MHDLKPYPEYRESGLQWLGKIPMHWNTRPAFGAYEPNHVRNIGMRERTVLSLSYGRVIIKPADKLHGLVPESFETYQIVNPGDIVLRTTDLQNDHTSLRVGMVRDCGIITSAYLSLRVKEGVNPAYGFQFLKVWDLSKAIYGYGSGLRQNLDFSHFKRMPISVPPPDEQAAIVRFVDHVNMRIEKSIRAKGRVIALLNEQKQVIIHRAVTKGLDTSVELKPSGIPGLGDIPKHWEIRRNGYLFTERIDRGRPGLPVLVVSLRTGVTIGKDTNETGRERRLIADLTSYKLACEGDIAYNMMRMWQGAMGVVPVQGLVSPAYVVARPSKGVHSKYYELLFRTDAYKGEINRNSRGIVSDRNRLYWNDFKRLVSPLPPYEEQTHIVEYLDAEFVGMNRAISRTEREIDLLREYRTRLITDVVTGKIDVRKVAAGLPNEVDELNVASDEEDVGEEAEE